MGIRSFYKSLSLTMKVVVIAATVFLLYMIAGFLIAPTIVRSKLTSVLTETFGRNVVVEQVRINPIVFSFTVGGFDMSELNGERFFHLDELYVNFQFSSLFRRAFTFAQIRIVAPDGQVKILPNGQFNFSDLMASLGTSDSSTEQSSILPPVLVSRFEIKRGRIAFSDLSHPTPFEVLLSPIELSLEEFSTEKDSVGSFLVAAKTDRGEWIGCEGGVSVNPLSSQGQFALSQLQTNTLWKYIQDQVGFVISDGFLDMEGGYQMGMSGGAIDLKLVDGNMHLGKLELVEKGSTVELFSIPSLTVKGIDIDLLKMEVGVDKVSVNNMQFHDRLEKDGIMHSQKLFIPATASEGDGGLFTNVNGTGREVQSWRFAVNEINVTESRIFMENHTLPEIQKLKFDPVTVKLKNVSSEKDSRMEISVDIGLNETGTVQVTGEAGLYPLLAVLQTKVDKLPLKSFQPTINAFTKINLVSGSANLDGTINYMSLGSEGPEVRYEGSAKIESVSISDQAFSEDLLKWDSLSVKEMVCDVMPYSLNISQVAVRKPYAKVIIWQDGTINLSTVLAMSDSQEGEEKLVLSKVLPEEGDQKRDSEHGITEESSTFDLTSFPISIDEVRFEDGSADFTDLSLKPNFTSFIQGLNGSVKGVTSEPGKLADVVLKGAVDKHSPVNIAGEINLLSVEKHTDISINFKNMELTTVTPYSAKFAGYPIEKGKMSLDLKYKLAESKLVGENKILVDQLTLGDRLENENAIKLPIKFAIALLKDRHGRIDLDLPIRGDLNDPEFNYGRVIMKTLVNMATKLVTSPFSVLAKLVGGGDEDLGSVDFAYGRSALSDGEIGKLDKLAKGLYERPTLRLEIKASADDVKDRNALAVRELHNRMLHEGGKKVAEGEDNSQTQDLSLSDEEYGRLIIKMYKRDFGHHPKKLFGSDGAEITKIENGEQGAQPEKVNTVEKSKVKPNKVEPGLVVAAAKRRLIENIVIDDAKLRILAQERAKEIKDHLIAKGEIPNEQLFILDVDITESTEDDHIVTTLSLSAR